MSLFLSNFDLTIQTLAAFYLLVATEYIIVSPDFFSAVAFISFLFFAYTSTNEAVNKSLVEAEQLANKELTSVLSAKSARLEEKLAILEVEQESLLALSQISNKFQPFRTSSVSYAEPLIQDAVYASTTLSHVGHATRHVNTLYTSLLDSAMFGPKGYYTLAKSALAAVSTKLVRNNAPQKTKVLAPAAFVKKRSGSSEGTVSVSALKLGASSKKLTVVGAASSVRKGKGSRTAKKESIISKIATKLAPKSSEEDHASKKTNSSRNKKR